MFRGTRLTIDNFLFSGTRDQTINMLDIKKALQHLKAELAQVNRLIDVMETMAAEKYQKRHSRALQQAARTASSGVRDRQQPSFVPPATLDPDVHLWIG
jgi:paraquat-inducible protein B